MTDLALPLPIGPAATGDSGVDAVYATLASADPDGRRAAAVFRDTFDQLYDGQRTGRFQWEQLYKTEKTHYGTLIEINLRREFKDVFDDGDLLDYRIAGQDVDCKYSHTLGGWMLPPECFEQLLLVCTASDRESRWSMGIVRASAAHRRTSTNRDSKAGLNRLGRQNISWLQHEAELPPNVLLKLDQAILDDIFSRSSGQQRLNQLFRRVTNIRIGRNTVATLAQQDDYMKRVRSNGGSRTTLADEGYLIPGGDYAVHREVAAALGAEVPGPGEFVSIPVVPADVTSENTVTLDGRRWRAARQGETPTVPAPTLPQTRKSA